MISDRSGLPKVGSFQIAQKRSLSRKLNKSFLNSLPNFFLTIFDDFSKNFQYLCWCNTLPTAKNEEKYSSICPKSKSSLQYKNLGFG